MKNPSDITNYVYEVNQIALRFDRRSYDFIPPKGFIICSYCDNGKLVLLEATGRGGSCIHVFPKDVTFECTEHSKKKKSNWFMRLFFK